MVPQDTGPTNPAPEPPGGVRPGGRAGLSVKRLAPAALLVAGLAAFFAFDLDAYLSLDLLKEHRGTMRAWVEANTLAAALLYMLVYAAAVAFSVPGATIITITGGFLYGPVVGTLYTVVGASVGAAAVFLAARYAVGDWLRAKAGPTVKRMETEFRDNGVSYMLILRLVPLFPFWLVNLVPAFLGVSFRLYMICTFVGIIPGSFVYALVGDGAGAVLDQGGDLDLGIIFSPRILAPIAGLALLACVPLVYRKIRERGARRAKTP